MTVNLERVKVLLNDPAMTDEAAEEIRDGFKALAEVIFESWQAERANKKLINNEHDK